MAELILVAATIDDRPDVAAWLLATADLKGIDQRLVLSRTEGFLVPAELLDEAEVAPKRDTSASEANLAKVVEIVKEVRHELAAERKLADGPRAWLKANGYAVGDKGRIGADLLEIYKAAVSSATDTKTEE